MPAILVLLFVVVPILEIVVVIQVGQLIGPWWTVAVLVADSLLGAWLLRIEGARAWRAFRQALEEGRWPGDEVAHGALVIVGGTLLLTPGFITDAVGFLLLIPLTRRFVAGTVRRRVRSQVVGGRAGVYGTHGRRPGGRGGRARPGVVDVEVVEIRREDGNPPGSPPQLGDETAGQGEDGARRSGADEPDAGAGEPDVGAGDPPAGGGRPTEAGDDDGRDP